MNNSSKMNITEKELEQRFREVDKSAVERKLREMGMNDVADRLRRTDNEEILRMIRSNPDILKKVNRMMGGK